MNKEDVQSLSKLFKYVVFKVSASWCKPCSVAKPYIDLFHKDAEQRIQSDIPLIEVDYDNDPIARRYLHVQSIPTLVLFIDGEMQHSCTGANEKNISIFYRHIK